GDRAVAALEALGRGRADQVDAFERVEPCCERRAETARRHHVAERRGTGVSGGEARRAEVTAVADVDRGDGAGVVAERRPGAEALEHPPRGPGEGDGALVEARLALVAGGERFDHGDAAPDAADGGREARSGEAAADDDEIELRAHKAAHEAISASMSSIALGASA